MFVLTIDQRGSRRGTDRVPELLAHLTDAPGLVRGFERTVGDEVQGVLDDARDVVELVLDLVRVGGWSVGVGAGPVHEPLPPSPRAASGEAFVLARAAVEAAKSRQRPVPLAVRGVDVTAAADAEAVLTLLGAVVVRRTAGGWEAVDAARAGDGQEVVARALGVTQQAVSQRLRAALWAEEQAVRPVAARLLTAAQG
ncbi:hypothetical protein GC089_09135 [Cellulomonas sp. JZ18]|uniref:hypothetical protein n=1 Tax=Cellulomonas sp. JZ18 TaxID=2654191 RepID=UPI0012D480E8|nr:hypothetical protein [Cellulomonas sp. JZ18]QGQ19366.1 hypothetical protein GC089_09135 [Cellulomonas sp. JZ18]